MLFNKHLKYFLKKRNILPANAKAICLNHPKTEEATQLLQNRPQLKRNITPKKHVTLLTAKLSFPFVKLPIPEP